MNGADGNLVGVTNPLLAPLANYGGPTQTMALLPGSPAIDAGTNTLIPAAHHRPARRRPIVDGTVDIGAFESSGFTIAVTSGSGQSASGAFPRPAGRDRHGQQLDRAGGRGFGDLHPAGQRGVGDYLGKPGGHRRRRHGERHGRERTLIGGSYTVLATANGAPVAAPFTLTNYALVSIAVSPGNPDTGIGRGGAVHRHGHLHGRLDSDITNTVAWASGTPSVATISGTGVATALAPGTTAITASLAGVTSPDDTLTVIAPSFVVNTTADAFGFYSGTTSLREAIAGANAVPGQTITFDNDGVQRRRRRST